MAAAVALLLGAGAGSMRWIAVWRIGATVPARADCVQVRASMAAAAITIARGREKTWLIFTARLFAAAGA